MATKRGPVGGTGSSPSLAKARTGEGEEVVEIMEDGAVAPMWWREEKESMMQMFANYMKAEVKTMLDEHSSSVNKQVQTIKDTSEQAKELATKAATTASELKEAMQAMKTDLKHIRATPGQPFATQCHGRKGLGENRGERRRLRQGAAAIEDCGGRWVWCRPVEAGCCCSSVPCSERSTWCGRGVLLLQEGQCGLCSL